MSDLIDRQAAIDALRYAQHRFTVADEAGGMGTVKWSEYVIYFAEAERILTELPSAQPEKRTENTRKTHGVFLDVIDRQAAIDALGDGALINYQAVGHNNGLVKAIDIIKGLPTAHPDVPDTNVGDMIDRQAAIDAVNAYLGLSAVSRTIQNMTSIQDILENLPAAQPELHHDEWCTDCKEYDQTKHCCPRFNRVIRTAMRDAQPEIIRCCDCKHWKNKHLCESLSRYGSYETKADFYCGYAERKTND